MPFSITQIELHKTQPHVLFLFHIDFEPVVLGIGTELQKKHRFFFENLEIELALSTDDVSI